MSTTTTTLQVVAFTQNAVWSGDLLAPDEIGTMTQVGTGGLAGPDIETAYMTDPKDGKTKLFAVDQVGSIIVDVVDNALTNWAQRVLDVGKGELPGQCAMICVYRGRMVLARQPSNLNILYFSRSLNPYDWLFGGLPKATSPIAATDPTVGQPADAIMALIPFNQDYLVVGCLSSLWVVVGDPGYGGQMQLGSRRTGILGPRSFCFDENGVCYVLGNSGLFRMVNPLQSPEPMTGRKLIQILDRVDTTDATGCRPVLKYDAFKKEIHIYLTPRNGITIGTHVIVDRDTGALWLDEYPARIGPHSALEIDGEQDDNRRLLVGGNDGFVRRWKSFEKSDDSTAIESSFDSSVMAPAGPAMDAMATELQVYGFADSDDVAFEWFAGASPDEVRTTATTSATGTISPGYNRPTGLRVRGNTHRLRVSQTSASKTWGIEKLFAKFIPWSRRRG